MAPCVAVDVAADVADVAAVVAVAVAIAVVAAVAAVLVVGSIIYKGLGIVSKSLILKGEGTAST